jgi:2-oxo-hept-3-ene-1,7-dioate hydratase
MHRRLASVLLALAAPVSSLPTHGDTPVSPWHSCPDRRAVEAYIADLEAGRVSRGFGDSLSLADAECARRALVRELPRVLGRVIGYKAAFTNRAAQERNGLKAPSWGVMFSRHMVESGARMSARFGARPHFEPDLVVVVKDAGLSEAATPREALRHIAAVVPFIELPDLMLDGTPPGPAFIAINIGFRAGVLGRPVEVDPTQEFLDSLGAMTVVMTEDVSGRELARARGSRLMGHPINVVMWLVQTLKQEGVSLKSGDLLSLGSFVPPAPTKAGTSITVRYVGMPGDPSVTVRFQ